MLYYTHPDTSLPHRSVPRRHQNEMAREMRRILPNSDAMLFNYHRSCEHIEFMLIMF